MFDNATPHSNPAVGPLPSGASWDPPVGARPLDLARMLETLVNNLEGMLFRCRIDAQWTMLFASGGCRELTGYAPEDLVLSRRVSYESIPHPEDRVRVRAALLEAVRGRRPYRVEYRIRRADGELCWVAERGRGVIDETGELVLEAFVEDIGEQVRARDDLALAEARYRSIFEHSSEGIFQTTADGRYLNANPALAAIYGYDSPLELMRELQDIGNQLYVDPEQRRRFKRLMAEKGAVQDFESQIRRRDGSLIWISENAHSVFGPDGEFLYYEGTVLDITERRRHEEELEHHANHDQLTGLPNRNLLTDRLQQAIRLGVRNSQYVVVAFIDLDNFKFINDSLGHLVGDQLLIEIARRLRECMRDTDTVARYGGDEFVLVLSGYYQIGPVVRLLERVIEAIARPVEIESNELFVTCSIGVAHYPVDGADAQTLLRHADAAMYLAKERGKNNFQFFTKRLNQIATERVRIESGLRRALERDEIEVWFQPKVDRERRCVGVEALARWHSAEYGPVPPAQFIGVAEDSGLIEPITEYILREACRQAVRLMRRGRPFHVAVNLSPRSFRQDGLPRMVADVLGETGLPAPLLELEITESAMAGDIDRCIASLYAIKALGVRIAIDDFGTGYSSLRYLQRFPIDTLKIDRSFVEDIARTPEGCPIAATIVSLGKNLRLNVVAEGVEDEAQFAVLRALQCEMYQGYLFARPMPVAEFEDDYNGATPA